jgi:NAD(P)-dependent dehydrogenase (short-subunit alcohol dehydrogenase family)
MLGYAFMGRAHSNAFRNIASVAAIVGLRDPAAYCPSKGAVVS